MLREWRRPRGGRTRPSSRDQKPGHGAHGEWHTRRGARTRYRATGLRDGARGAGRGACGAAQQAAPAPDPPPMAAMNSYRRCLRSNRGGLAKCQRPQGHHQHSAARPPS
eukprot:7851105-Alexandrium_andersonii.AAC.1